MTCPRCREAFDLMAFTRLTRPRAFRRELNPTYKCPREGISKQGECGCGFIFSPREALGEDIKEDDE